MTQQETLASRYGEVTVSADVRVARDGQHVTIAYLVTGHSRTSRTTRGYHAVLPACGCERIPCAARLGVTRRHAVQGVWHIHDRTHCHGWHWERACAFARDVLATYAPPRAGTAASAGVSASKYRRGVYAPKAMS